VPLVLDLDIKVQLAHKDQEDQVVPQAHLVPEPQDHKAQEDPQAQQVQVQQDPRAQQDHQVDQLEPQVLQVKQAQLDHQAAL
jgi:hypothetical protein